MAGLMMVIVLIFNLVGTTSPVIGRAPLVTPSYYVDDTGSGTACTQAAPCLLATALAKPDTYFNVFFAAGTYTGSGNEVILLTKNISLYGGWDGTTTYPAVRDPDLYQSVIDGQDARRGITILGGGVDELSPMISGLWITNGNASGLTANCDGNIGTPSGCGGGIFINDASPYIQGNHIYANTASKGGATLHSGYGGGIYARDCSGTRITGNQITDNLADSTRQGAGGGVSLRLGTATTEIDHNTIANNSAGVYPEHGFGAGILLSYDLSYIHDNNLIGNGVQDNGRVHGSAIHLWYGSPTIVHNLITGNRGDDAVYFGYGDNTNFSSNRLFNNQTANGVYLVNSNRTETACTADNMMLVSNNFISHSNEVGLSLNGDGIQGLCAYVFYNSIDGGATGIYYEGIVDADVENNIVSNHSIMGIDTSLLTTTPMVLHTLFYNNIANGYIGTSPVYGDPKYRQPSEGNLHISCTSAARDAGSPLLLVDYDFDDQIRPVFSGVDIGADECTPFFYLPLVHKN